MAVGKNKRISRSKKGGKKKIGDPFLKKEWYELKAPLILPSRSFGKTLVTKSQGTKLAIDGLKGRVYEVNLADLNGDEDQGHRKLKLLCEDVQGRNCLTDFAGLDMTRHHLASHIRKWHSLIEAHVDVKTADGYTLRLFVIAFSKRGKNQVKSTCYIRTSKARIIRKKMIQIMVRETEKCTLNDLIRKIPLNTIERAIASATLSTYPLQNIYLRKIKVIKRPKLDVSRLMDLQAEGAIEGSAPVVAETTAAQNILTAEIEGTA